MKIASGSRREGYSISIEQLCYEVLSTFSRYTTYHGKCNTQKFEDRVLVNGWE
jgi:hypothetical protein